MFPIDLLRIKGILGEKYIGKGRIF